LPYSINFEYNYNVLKGLSGGVIAGIVIGAIAGTILIVVGVVCWLKKKKRSKNEITKVFIDSNTSEQLSKE
jgi:hypothetical protein